VGQRASSNGPALKKSHDFSFRNFSTGGESQRPGRGGLAQMVSHGIGEVGLAQSDHDLNDLLVKVTWCQWRFSE
jgi:hypothetical protein